MPAHKGSINSNLVGLEVNESRFVEVGKDNYLDFMRKASATSRYPKELKGQQFTCALFKAISVKASFEAIPLIKITRIK